MDYKREVIAAGILFSYGEEFLLLKHAKDGLWGPPAGTVEDGENPLETARREALEETGIDADTALMTLWSIGIPDGIDREVVFFGCHLKERVIPHLQRQEVYQYQWFNKDNFPSPEELRFDTLTVIDRFHANLIEVARMVANEKITSPAVFLNIYLFAVRVSGTGWAYRGNGEEEGIFALRDPKIWLQSDVMESWQGAPVVIGHPPDTTDDAYVAQKQIGSIMFTYIKDNELWGVARIQNRNAVIELLRGDYSTSPGVKAHPNSDEGITEQGENYIIEGKPYLSDHLAICIDGVWDKYGNNSKGVAK